MQRYAGQNANTKQKKGANKAFQSGPNSLNSEGHLTPHSAAGLADKLGLLQMASMPGIWQEIAEGPCGLEICVRKSNEFY